ncbi:MAG: hypothetical protein M3Y39_01925 [Chloroflexota bacterium]|nr:hypothetical protein [Chloroflexota bacterium]
MKLISQNLAIADRSFSNAVDTIVVLVSMRPLFCSSTHAPDCCCCLH